jgi:hypothetical protein
LRMENRWKQLSGKPVSIQVLIQGSRPGLR